MNSAQTIVDCATEKRRLNPDYSPSLDELKAVDVVVTARIRAGDCDKSRDLSRYEPSVSLHQQDGGITVQAFADQHGISLKMMRYYIKKGRVIGARQDSRSNKWTIYPPAMLLDNFGLQKRVPDALGFDVGTSPHGLSVDLPEQVQETCEESNLSLPAKPVLILPVAVSTARNEVRTEQNSEGQSDADSPGVYRSPKVRSASRCLREAVANKAQDISYLRLTKAEYMEVYFAVREYRDRVSKAIGKGKAEYGDLHTTDSLWSTLKAVVQNRTGAFWL